MDNNQVKTAIESLGQKTFEAFKKRTKENLKKSNLMVLLILVTSDKLSKIEKDLDKLEDVNQAVTKQN